ncbi:MAG: metal-dependent transcriptional regulator [Abitibacteriaceae bacterium]|nr:metal-dependent transcriptional regulator [Abditibacteriaceae bacterium]
MLSAAAEDYLKTIYKLRAEAATVTTQALADRLGVAAPSATAMVKKLAAMKLLRHTPYRGVELTAAGEKIALEVIRHHRLVETYLAEVLGVAWDKVHEEAERWEHVLSDEVEAKMAAALNYPTHDPHGAPIPSHDGQIAQDKWTCLAQIPAGARVTVRRVSDENAEVLRHLREIGLILNAAVEVLRSVPSEGVMQLRIDGKEQIVGAGPTKAVFVAEN